MTPSQSKPAWSIRVNAKVRLRPPNHPQAIAVAAMFGLRQGATHTLYDDLRLPLCPGQILAVIGPSGAGKSVLLRKLAARYPRIQTLPVEALSRCDLPAVAALQGGSLAARLELLSRCGLADAHALITPAKHLSGGQLYRLALAQALHLASQRRRPTLVMADEFGAILDELTTTLLCRQIRKLVRGSNLAFVLATPRPQLLAALEPDWIVAKPLGAPAQLIQPDAQLLARLAPAASDPANSNWTIQPGTIHDYRDLAAFHYVAGPPAAHKRVYVIRPNQPGPLDPPLAAVLVVSPPVICVRGRNIATCRRYLGPDRRSVLRRLNAEMECISRVIVHPTYRGSGLALALVRHALHHAQTPLMESLAAMGRISPIFTRAGMTSIGLCPGRDHYYSYFIAHTDTGPPIIEWLHHHEQSRTSVAH